MLRAGQTFYLNGRPERYLRFALAGTTRSRDEKALDRDAGEALIELALPVARRWVLFFDGRYAREEYADESAAFFFIPEPREDRWASAVFSVSLHSYLTLRYACIDRDVDPDLVLPLSYERRIATVGMTWHW